MEQSTMIIDKDSAQRQLLCTVIKEKLGYASLGFAGGREATNHLVSGQSPVPDIIVFDIATTAGAYEIIANLRLLAISVPIIVLTAYADYESSAAAIAAGAEDFLSKPVAVERLNITLRNALQLRDARRDAQNLRHESLQEYANTTRAPGSSSCPLIAHDGNVRPMEDLEAEAIRFAMQYYNGRMTEVARRLGIGRSTLYRKLSELSVREEVAA